MNMKKFLGVGVLVALVVGTLSLYMLFKDDTSEVVSAPVAELIPQKETVQEVTPIAGTDTLQSLLALGQNLECTIAYTLTLEGKPSVTEGTYFTSRGRMRGDFLVPGMVGGSVSSMILADDVLYSWTEIEGEKYGMKITLRDLAQSKTTEGAPGANEAVPLDTAVAYDCKPWLALDGSVFEVPTDVLFKDYKDIISVGMEYGTSYEERTGGTVSCAACEQLSGTEKVQCRKALSCE